MKRREFIAGLGSAAAWPLAARGQQPAMPVVGLVGGGGGDISTRYVTAFRKGLNETGYAEGQNVVVEYHWLRPIRSKSSCSIRVDHAGGGVPADREAAA